MKIKRPDQSSGKPLVLGLSGFTSISAVEGIRLPAASKRMFARFEARGMTAEERRKAIIEKHARKA